MNTIRQDELHGDIVLAKDDTGIELHLVNDHALYLSFPKWTPRRIGTISTNRHGKRIYMKELQARHRFEKFDAFGFNEKVIEVMRPDWIIVLYDGCPLHPHGLYSIRIEKFQEVKKYMHFKKQGFELQCFIPVSEFEYKEL